MTTATISDKTRSLSDILTVLTSRWSQLRGPFVRLERWRGLQRLATQKQFDYEFLFMSRAAFQLAVCRGFRCICRRGVIFLSVWALMLAVFENHSVCAHSSISRPGLASHDEADR